MVVPNLLNPALLIALQQSKNDPDLNTSYRAGYSFANTVLPALERGVFAQQTFLQPPCRLVKWGETVVAWTWVNALLQIGHEVHVAFVFGFFFLVYCPFFWNHPAKSNILQKSQESLLVGDWSLKNFDSFCFGNKIGICFLGGVARNFWRILRRSLSGNPCRSADWNLRRNV